LNLPDFNGIKRFGFQLALTTNNGPLDRTRFTKEQIIAVQREAEAGAKAFAIAR
jgi:hypothetical protein